MILESFEELRLKDPVALCIGVFDGVHLGHQKILEALISEAKKISGKSVVITFKNHPKGFIKKSPLLFIQPLDARFEQLKALGVDLIVALQFDAAFQKLTASEFFDLCTSVMDLKTLILGHDTSIGSDMVRDPLEIQKLLPSVKIVQVPPLKMDGVIISSQKIRKALESGDVDTAHRWLGN